MCRVRQARAFLYARFWRYSVVQRNLVHFLVSEQQQESPPALPVILALLP